MSTRRRTLLVRRSAASLALAGAACANPERAAGPTAPADAAKISAADAARGSIGFLRAVGLGRSRSDLSSAAIVPLNDIRRIETIFNTDFVSAGVGAVRDRGTGTLALTGVGGPVSRAYLVWQGPTNTNNPAVGASITVDGTQVTGEGIGFSSDNCWGYQNSQAWRADVTALVQAKGNGSYVLTNLPSSQASGAANTNGLSLIVFFQDGNPANNRDVVFYDGNDSNIPNPFDAPGWNVTLSGITYASGTANMQLHVGDGQTFPDDGITVNGVQIVAPGSVFDGLTSQGVDGGPNTNGRLWDVRSFDVTARLTPGPNTLSLTSGVNSDCLSLVAALVDLPTGAAPTPPIAFAPSTISLTKTGTVTVYLYSQPGFDATQADAAEVRLIIDNRLPGAPVAQRSPGQYLTNTRDYNGDGLVDRAFFFTMASLRTAGLTTASTGFVLADRTAPFVFEGRPRTLPSIVP